MFLLALRKALWVRAKPPDPPPEDGRAVTGRVQRRVPFRDSLWMPLTARTAGRRLEPRSEARAKGVLQPTGSKNSHGRMRDVKRRLGGVERHRSSVASAGLDGAGRLSGGASWKAAGTMWRDRGRYGTPPVRKGSAARGRREGKAFPPNRWKKSVGYTRLNPPIYPLT